FLGLLTKTHDEWFQGPKDPPGPSEERRVGMGPAPQVIEALIKERQEAKANKDFARADEIRDDLKSKGIILEDGAGGTTWRRED
ncbi:MAG: hypothetical protein V3R64_01905, partial [Sphingomonadales bacterium]